MKFRKGDIVSVRGVVKYDDRADSAGLLVDIPGIHQTAMFSPREQVQAELRLEQAKFEIGDDVWWGAPDNIQVGTVLAIANDHLWLDLGNGDYCTRMTGHVGRVEPKDEVDAAAS